VTLIGADLDESPMAYRRLPEVLAHHSETVKVLHTLQGHTRRGGERSQNAARWRQAIELALSEEDVTRLGVVARSRTEPASRVVPRGLRAPRL
jgi:hypothetical protein